MTQDELRRHNLGTLLREVHQSGALTRAELTSRMGLSRSTIKDLVAELCGLGALREEPPAGARAGAGRPSLVVSARPDLVQVLAVDVGVDRVVVGLVGLGGRVVVRRHRRLTSARPSVAAVVGLVRRLVDAVLADPAAGGRVVGLGVSVPGVIRQSDGFVRFAPNLGWVDEPFGALLDAQFEGLRVGVGNDADLGVLAEHRRGIGRGVDDIVFIAGEVGVGGGMILGGRPMLGAGGYAGEFGHMPVRAGGRRCRCGSCGCWETEVGAPAVARALGLPGASTDELVRAVRAATAEQTDALDEVGHYLGLGLATIVNVVNPRLVVIGGLLGEVYPATAQVVRAGLESAALAAAAEQVQLAVPQLGGDAVLVGAAEMAWEELLLDPATVLGAGSSSSPASVARPYPPVRSLASGRA